MSAVSATEKAGSHEISVRFYVSTLIIRPASLHAEQFHQFSLMNSLGLQAADVVEIFIVTEFAYMCVARKLSACGDFDIVPSPVL